MARTIVMALFPGFQSHFWCKKKKKDIVKTIKDVQQAIKERCGDIATTMKFVMPKRSEICSVELFEHTGHKNVKISILAHHCFEAKTSPTSYWFSPLSDHKNKIWCLCKFTSKTDNRLTKQPPNLQDRIATKQFNTEESIVSKATKSKL